MIYQNIQSKWSFVPFAKTVSIEVISLYLVQFTHVGRCWDTTLLIPWAIQVFPSLRKEAVAVASLPICNKCDLVRNLLAALGSFSCPDHMLTLL